MTPLTPVEKGFLCIHDWDPMTPQDGTNPARILVIEDDPGVAAGVVQGLRAAGFAVDLVSDGTSAMTRAVDPRWSLIVLDLMLPGADGFAILEHLRSRVAAPVIVLTARSGLDDRLRSFGLGAADFLTKPFWVEELVARISARLRLPPQARRRRVQFGDVEIDLDARTVSRGTTPVRLTPVEMSVLAYLDERRGRAVERWTMADAVLRGASEVEGRSIDVHVARLRKKLGPAGRTIATVWGIGYRLEGAVE